MSNFGSGHDLTVRGLEPRMGLCADSSEPGVCFRFCVSLSLYAPPPFMLSLSQKKKKCIEKEAAKYPSFSLPTGFMFQSPVSANVNTPMTSSGILKGLGRDLRANRHAKK